MAVRSVTSFQVRPGKMAECMANMGELKKMFERLGGSVRVSTVTVGGPNTNNILLAVEHKDMEAYGAWSSKLQADSAWQTYLAKVQGQGDPAATLVGRVLLSDLAI